MNGVINHKNNMCIWYHTTNNKNVGKILREGIKICSESENHPSPESWIYLSSEPEICGNNITIFSVDLSFIKIDECELSVFDDLRVERKLRVLIDIPLKHIKILERID